MKALRRTIAVAVDQIGAGGNRGAYSRNIAKGTGTVFIQKTF
jgi:hypothetical protein